MFQVSVKPSVWDAQPHKDCDLAGLSPWWWRPTPFASCRPPPRPARISTCSGRPGPFSCFFFRLDAAQIQLPEQQTKALRAWRAGGRLTGCRKIILASTINPVFQTVTAQPPNSSESVSLDASSFTKLLLKPRGPVCARGWQNGGCESGCARGSLGRRTDGRLDDISEPRTAPALCPELSKKWLPLRWQDAGESGGAHHNFGRRHRLCRRRQDLREPRG